jgi:hypothetical protein
MLLFGHRATAPGRLLSDNKVVLAVTAASMSVGVIIYSIPRMLIAWRGYTPLASSFLFRSGLDGDTRYFSNMVQSILAPCPTACCWGRTTTDLIFPAFIPLALVAMFAWRAQVVKSVPLGHLFLFLCTPYFLSLILFPQSISIHPYMYDHLLLLPVVVTASVGMLTPAFEAWLTGTRLLGFLLITSGVLMTNLIDIAQGLAAMPVRP